MKALLACYKARDGEDEAARRLLREIGSSPANWYNLACTYALLGEVEPALEYLKRDFESDRHTPATLARQRRWARKDPDLEGLRDDPRFRALVGADGDEPEAAPAEVPR
jgi:tetratricopeptide (TPR) repeat protein